MPEVFSSFLASFLLVPCRTRLSKLEKEHSRYSEEAVGSPRDDPLQIRWFENVHQLGMQVLDLVSCSVVLLDSRISKYVFM